MIPRRHIPRRLVALLGAALLLVSSLPPAAPRTGASDEPLRYLGGPMKTLDPAFIADAADAELILQLYAGLTRIDEAGNVYPSLASGWRVSADGRTYTFTLRDGLRFSDGSPLRAADVRRSWLRLLDPATRASAPDLLSVIDGARERLRGGPESGVAIEATDDVTLVVRLRQPGGYFPAITATPATFVVPPTAGRDGSWQRPDRFVGSGPYVVSGTDGGDLLLAANERYAAGAPPIAAIRWVASIDGDPVSAFAAGQLDLAQVSPADVGWIRYDRQLGPRLHQAAALSVQYFGFDTSRPPFSDARVRRAFALALDRPRLVELSLGSSATPAGSIVPPALQPEGSVLQAAPRSANVAEARRLLDEAGYADRSKLGTITVDASALDVRPAVATWRSVLGVEIAVETMSFSDYLVALEEHPPQLFTVNWIADYPSPQALYGLLLAPGAASNYGGWDDERFSSLLDAASAAATSAEGSAYAQVEERVDSEVPLLPWSYEAGWWLTRDGLSGLGNLTVGLLDFGRVGRGS